MYIYSIEEILKAEKIVIFGCGYLGERLCYCIRKKYGIICAASDNDENKWGRYLGKTKIICPQEVIERFSDALYCIASIKHCDEIEDQLKEMGIPKSKIVKIDNERFINEVLVKCGKYDEENDTFIFNFPYARNFRQKLQNTKYKLLDLINCLRMTGRYVPGKTKKYKVSICAIFKNEAKYLREWIEFHLLVGVDHFYLYNNFSDDNYLDVLAPYIESGLVSLFDWSIPQGQMKAYKDCLERYRDESLWIGMIDIDEFVVPVKFNSIYEFLSQYDHKYGSILIYWKNYGTGGIISRNIDTQLVTEDFTVCWRKYTDVGKCFVNTNFEYEFNDLDSCFHHEAWTSFRGIKYPPINCFNHISLFQKYNCAKETSMPIQINHYIVKSYFEMKNKLEKGDVLFKENEYKRKYLMDYERYNSSIDYSAYKYLLKLKIKIDMVEKV